MERDSLTGEKKSSLTANLPRRAFLNAQIDSSPGVWSLTPFQCIEMGARMFVQSTWWMWTRGRFTVSVTAGLDPRRRYLVTGGLEGKSGGDYGQVFISTVCVQRSPDQILSGVRDDPASSPNDNIANLGVLEFLSNATRVTIKLRADGGLHRAQAVIYDIT
jgi:hypothetical protein